MGCRPAGRHSGVCPAAPTCPTRNRRARKIREETWTFERPLRLWVDGIDKGSVRSLRVAVEPDAATVLT